MGAPKTVGLHVTAKKSLILEEGGLEMAGKALILLPLGSGVQSLSS